MLARFLMVLAVLAVALMPAAAKTERRVALVIGNSSYKHATSLRNPGNDATDVADTLKKLGFEVVVGTDLDQQGFAKTVEQFARVLDEAEVGLFFYAGHGLQMNDKNYLVSVNARLENEFLLSSETIELDAIVRLMESKAPINLVFLDACRNNPLTDNLRRSLTALKRSAQLGRGLARMEASGRDTLIAFAAAPGQEAADGAERNSPFTAALLKHLPKPGLEVSVMLKEVAADVRRDTRNGQRPQQLSDMTKAFYFARAEVAATRTDAPTLPEIAKAPPAMPSDDRALDVAFWNAAQSANDCDAVRAYLQRFPYGVFVELAKLSERRLCVPGRKVTVVDPNTPGSSATNAASVPFTPASEPPPAVIAALPEQNQVSPVESRPGTGPSGTEVVRAIQLELYRLGCGTSEADGKWTVVTREGIRKFNKYTRTKLDMNEPSSATVAALQKQNDRACPVECGRGFAAKGDTCVAVKPAPVKKKERTARRPAKRSHAQAQQQQQQQQGGTVNNAPPTAAAPISPMGGMFMFGFGRRRF